MKGSNKEMKNWKKGIAAACATLLVFSQPVHAEGENAETKPVQIELKHVHAGNNTEEGGCYTAVYHRHDGNADTGGNCYKDAAFQDYGTRLYERKEQCTGIVTQWWRGTDDIFHTNTSCGHNCDSGLCRGVDGPDLPAAGGRCQYQNVVESYIACNKCGKKDCNGRHLVYSLTCDEIEGVTLEGYAPSCGMTEDTVIGTYSIMPSVQAGIVGEMEIKAVVAGSVQVIGYQWGSGEASDSITVNGNGSYTCQITYSDGEEEFVQSLTIQVKNIDNMPPKVSIETVNGVQEVTVRVNAFDVPESAESLCSGLAAKAYSWDGGNTWTAESFVAVTEAGDCEIWVRDNAGNIAKKIFYIKTDYTPPVVSLSAAGGWTRGNVEIVAEAKDGIPAGTNPDVSGGDATGSIGISGLALQAYSWDGGNTWTGNSQITVSDNGSYSVIVRDNAGNTAHAEITVSCIDRSAPVITEVDRQYEEWRQSEESMEITVHASDTQSGLAAAAYSFDGGNTWTDNNCYIVTEEGSITIAVRDMLGNTVWKQMEFLRIEEPAEEQAEPEPEKPMVRQPAAQATPEPEETPEPKEIQEALPAPVPMPTEPPAEETEPVEEKEIVEVPDIITPKSAAPVIAVATGTGTATSGAAVVILFWIFRKCLLLDSTGRKLGKAYIWKKKGKYFVQIPAAAVKQAEGCLTVQFRKNFVRSNRDKSIDIRVNQQFFEKSISEKIQVNFK